MTDNSHNDDKYVPPNLARQHKLDLSEIKEDKVSESARKKLNEIIEQVPLASDEFSFMGLTVKISQSNDIIATLLIRNGSTDDIQLKQLPLILYDAQGDIGAKGTFKLSQLTIDANTSKPISVVFPQSSILKKELDLSKWSIRHIR